MGLAALILLCGVYVSFLSYCYYYVQAIPRHRLESGWFVLVAVAALGFLCSQRRRQDPRISEPMSASTAVPLASGWLLALISSVLLYWPALWVGFLSDDYVLVTAASGGYTNVSFDWYFRPLPLLVWHVLLASGSGPVGLHLTNILVHASNAVLTGLVALRFGLPRRLALGAAGMFLVLPTSVEAVAWVSGFQDLLVTALCLVFVLLLRSVRRTRRFLLVMAVLVVALGTKEVAVAAPILGATTYVGSPGNGRWRERMAAVAAASGLAIAFAVWRLASATFSAFLEVPSRYLVQKMLSHAFGTLAVPWTRAELNAAPRSAFAWAIAITIMVVFSTSRFIWDRDAAVRTVRLSAWIVVAVAPVYSSFFVAPDLEGSRYLYLASPAWAISIVYMWESTWGSVFPRRIAAGCLCALAMVLALGTRSHLQPWVAASDLRQALLASAATAVENPGCQNLSFHDLPDSVAGAYVFRNGFYEALSFDEVVSDADVVLVSEADRPQCRLHWDGEMFNPVRQ